MRGDEGDVTDSGLLQGFTIEPTRGLRYAELAMIGESAITINSTGLSAAPPEQWDELDTDMIVAAFGLKAVFKNGPHWWLSDRTTFRFGNRRTFGGMGFRWAATLPLALAGSGGLEGKAYETFQANKRGTFVYSPGKPVYELVSPDGRVSVMQWSNFEPDDTWSSLGDRLGLAGDWSFRTRTLDKDLTHKLEGDVEAVLDDLRNVCNLEPDTGAEASGTSS